MQFDLKHMKFLRILDHYSAEPIDSNIFNYNDILVQKTDKIIVLLYYIQLV